MMNLITKKSNVQYIVFGFFIGVILGAFYAFVEISKIDDKQSLNNFHRKKAGFSLVSINMRFLTPYYTKQERLIISGEFKVKVDQDILKIGKVNLNDHIDVFVDVHIRDENKHFYEDCSGLTKSKYVDGHIGTFIIECDRIVDRSVALSKNDPEVFFYYDSSDY